MSIGPDEPTPNPDATLKEILYRELTLIRREFKREMDEVRGRTKRLEEPHEDIISTINRHDDRLDRHDDRLNKLDEVSEALNKHFKTDEIWQSGISHTVTQILEQQRELMRELMALAGRKP